MKTGKAGTDRRPDSIQTLLALISQSYNTKAWHGTNLRGSIRGLTARQAAWRPAPNRHNIWEIVVHCAYWKYIVRRRILGEKRGSFPLKGSNWFRRDSGLSERQWRSDIAMLESTHRSMCDAVARLKTGALPLKPRGSKVDNLAIIMGIASHDLYHAGQIQLLKRLIR
ncbi:MAG TPA: hypothetical protein DEP53_00405 [Bacteroidetes bacterium]|nr:hypothetical protein [Bacteroidota bacterium]